MNKQDATKAIALTLAELAGIETPNVVAWEQAKLLADKFEAAGHIKPEPKVEDDEELVVYGWGAVDPEGRFITNFTEQQRAINYVDDARRMAKAAGLASNYRVAAVVDQGGL